MPRILRTSRAHPPRIFRTSRAHPLGVFRFPEIDDLSGRGSGGQILELMICPEEGPAGRYPKLMNCPEEGPVDRSTRGGVPSTPDKFLLKGIWLKEENCRADSLCWKPPLELFQWYFYRFRSNEKTVQRTVFESKPS